MIELFEKDIKTADRKSSKGNQLKFERDGIWYKADNLGYEGLAECVVSALLPGSSLNADEYTVYDYETIEYNKIQYKGCKSHDFTKGWKLITLERLFLQTYGISLNKMIFSTEDHEERLRILVEQTERVTGIKNFGPYMNKLLAVDALFLNEDRHTHNIAVLMGDNDQFKLCPVFDNGGALLSDTSMDYPLGRDVYELMENARPKTFSDSFEASVEIFRAYALNSFFALLISLRIGISFKEKRSSLVRPSKNVFACCKAISRSLLIDNGHPPRQMK